VKDESEPTYVLTVKEFERREKLRHDDPKAYERDLTRIAAGKPRPDTGDFDAYGHRIARALADPPELHFCVSALFPVAP